jgi:hypothetical protein
MDLALVMLISLLVGALALAFYMDWLGLWVSKEEMKDQIARAKERMLPLGMQSEDKSSQAAAPVKEASGAEASRTRT